MLEHEDDNERRKYAWHFLRSVIYGDSLYKQMTVTQTDRGPAD